MKRLAIAAVVPLCALAAKPADASSCSGGDTSSSSSSSTSSSSYEPATPACVETSDVHGYRECTRFGAWSGKKTPTVWLEVGFAMRSFASPLGAESGTVTHEMESFSYRVVGPAAQPAAGNETAAVGTLRLGAPLRHGLYLAGELELGALAGSSVAAEMTSSGQLGTPTLTPSTVAVFGGLAVAGFSTRLGGVDVGVEVAGGVRALAYTYDSSYLACQTTTTVSAASGVLEGRARATLWLSPFMSASAFAGKSALSDGGMVGGITLGFTNRAFGR